MKLAHGVIIALLLALVALLLEHARLGAALAESRLELSNERANVKAVGDLRKADIERLEGEHKTAQMISEDRYELERLALQKRSAAADLDVARLRKQLEASTSTSGRAANYADPATCERDALRLETLGAMAGEGYGLLREAERLLDEREIAIERYAEQIEIDRMFCQK